MTMPYPAVSCCMPTYGRPIEIINESVKSFLDQDYPGKKELIVYNDNGMVEFKLDHPEVKIINTTNREPTLGEKYNKTVEYASHEYIMLWDDDDINLCHRIKTSIKKMVDGVFMANKNFILYAGRDHIESVNSYYPATLCIEKEQFFNLGGYDPKDKGADLNIALHVKNIMKTKESMSDQDIFYIYNWSPQTRYHHSAVTRNHSDEKARELIDKKIPDHLKGTFIIIPQYYRDYSRLVCDYYAKKSI